MAQQIERLAAELAQRQKERDELVKLETELIDLIVAKEDEIQLVPLAGSDRSTGARLGEKERVSVVPDPTRRVPKQPRLIEVRAEGIVVHPEKTEYPLEQLEQKNSGLAKFLVEADEARNRQYLLLLIHPNGAAAYTKLRLHLLHNYNEVVQQGGHRFRKTRIDLGVEPFSQEWLLFNQ